MKKGEQMEAKRKKNQVIEVEALNKVRQMNAKAISFNFLFKELIIFEKETFT